jgi:hypothetical protein
MIVDDVHDKLVKAFLDYFTSNEIFQHYPSDKKRRVVRRHLSVIKELCFLRRKEVLAENKERKAVDRRQFNLTPRAIAARKRISEQLEPQIIKNAGNDTDK